jgi:hypothetical protein
LQLKANATDLLFHWLIFYFHHTQLNAAAEVAFASKKDVDSLLDKIKDMTACVEAVEVCTLFMLCYTKKMHHHIVLSLLIVVASVYSSICTYYIYTTETLGVALCLLLSHATAHAVHAAVAELTAACLALQMGDPLETEALMSKVQELMKYAMMKWQVLAALALYIFKSCFQGH